MRPDLIKHFIGGALIAAMVALAFSRDLDALTSALVGLTAATAVGVAKEALWDRWLGRGVSDIDDLYATIGGGALGAAAWIPISMLLDATRYGGFFYAQ